MSWQYLILRGKQVIPRQKEHAPNQTRNPNLSVRISIQNLNIFWSTVDLLGFLLHSYMVDICTILSRTLFFRMQDPCRSINPWTHLNLFRGEFSLMAFQINYEILRLINWLAFGNLNVWLTYFIHSIKFAEVECNINIQNAEPIHDSKDSNISSSANETLARNEW